MIYSAVLCNPLPSLHYQPGIYRSVIPPSCSLPRLFSVGPGDLPPNQSWLYSEQPNSCLFSAHAMILNLKIEVHVPASSLNKAARL